MYMKFILKHQSDFSEICGYLQDLDMYHAETDTPAVARTSNLNEELGQVSVNKCRFELFATYSTFRIWY